MSTLLLLFHNIVGNRNVLVLRFSNATTCNHGTIVERAAMASNNSNEKVKKFKVKAIKTNELNIWWYIYNFISFHQWMQSKCENRDICFNPWKTANWHWYGSLICDQVTHVWTQTNTKHKNNGSTTLLFGFSKQLFVMQLLMDFDNESTNHKILMEGPMTNLEQANWLISTSERYMFSGNIINNTNS